jgi:BlaR1 peptidase M56
MADARNTHAGVVLERPATVAAARLSRAGLLLGALGLGASLFVVVRLVEAWRLTAHSGSHRFSILGLTLAYPAANAGAIVILVLAILGLLVIAIAVLTAAHEIAGSIRLGRRLQPRRRTQVNGALIIPDAVPRAFCAGLFAPRIYISSAAIDVLDEPALQAVLAHERHHAQRRDPLRLATGRVIARALFFLPPLAELARRHQSLAELGADENAVDAALGDRSALARAMLAFDESGSSADGVGIDPERVEHLLGEPRTWRFPALLCIAAGAILALIGAVAALAGEAAVGSASLAPPFLSGQPCVIVLAMIPTAIALIGGHFALAGRSRVR